MYQRFSHGRPPARADPPRDRAAVAPRPDHPPARGRSPAIRTPHAQVRSRFSAPFLMSGTLGSQRCRNIAKFGCSVPKVARCGGGSALPWKRKLFGDIVRSAVEGASGSPEAAQEPPQRKSSPRTGSPTATRTSSPRAPNSTTAAADHSLRQHQTVAETARRPATRIRRRLSDWYLVVLLQWHPTDRGHGPGAADHRGSHPCLAPGPGQRRQPHLEQNTNRSLRESAQPPPHDALDRLVEAKGLRSLQRRSRRCRASGTGTQRMSSDVTVRSRRSGPLAYASAVRVAKQGCDRDGNV